MTKEESIEIQLSKTKMTLTFIGSIIFFGIGIWFIVNPPKIKNPLIGNPISMLIIGLITVTLFGFVAITILRKFSDKKAGLIISGKGIVDNSSGVSAGLIPWSDINNIEIVQIMSQKFIMIIVNNPDEYLEKVKNPIKRNTMKLNYKSYGSPISISSNALQINFDNLHDLILEKMKTYKS